MIVKYGIFKSGVCKSNGFSEEKVTFEAGNDSVSRFDPEITSNYIILYYMEVSFITMHLVSRLVDQTKMKFLGPPYYTIIDENANLIFGQ